MKNIKYILFYSFILFFLNCPSERFLSPKNPFSYDSQKAGAEIVEVNDLEVEFLYDEEIISSVSIDINKTKSYIGIDNNIYEYDLSEDKIINKINNDLFHNGEGVTYNRNNKFYYLYGISQDITEDGDYIKEISYEEITITEDFLNFDIIFKESTGMRGINLNYWEKYDKLMIYRYTKDSSINDLKFYELKYNNSNYFFEEYNNEILNQNILSNIFDFNDDNILFAVNEYKIYYSYWRYESKFLIKNVFTTDIVKEINVDYLGLKVLRPLTVYYEAPYIWFIAENFENWKLQLIQIRIL